jgi:hypothetical protein
MEFAALIVGLTSAIALIGTLLLVARQTRSLASQTELANKLAVLSASDESVTGLRSIHLVLLDHPELRRYFYDGAELPKAAESEQDHELRDRVLLVAELLADALVRAINANRTLEVSEVERASWEDLINYFLTMSPAMRAQIEAQPMWWPSLTERLLSLAPVTRSNNS